MMCIRQSMDILEWGILILMVINLFFTITFVVLLSALIRTIEPLIEQFNKLGQSMGGKIPTLSQIFSLAMAKIVGEIDFTKMLGGLGGQK